VSLSERNPYEVHAEYVQRLASLEQEVALLRAQVEALLVVLEEQDGKPLLSGQ
jgi:hypothetical protein